MLTFSDLQGKLELVFNTQEKNYAFHFPIFLKDEQICTINGKDYSMLSLYLGTSLKFYMKAKIKTILTSYPKQITKQQKLLPKCHNKN